MRLSPFVSALAALAVMGVAAACAPATGSNPSSGLADTPRRCFQVDRVQNFRATADQTLYLRTSRRDVFEARALGACRDLDWALGITLAGQGVSTVCTGDTAFVVPRGGGAIPDGPCRIQVVRQLTPEQIAALPDRDRP
ncbi:MAG: DUF6491 family protein [Brevundimonas sp.]|jgi:hypothetical protein|uniref:DUF6491 family protein n=1 Tax=Brevundimonas sp. TaxID=1871086 RepID=UPI00258EF405|nr:DUF6491 family protein [Brevundimonas sp.]MCV0414886.1 DUF6491 family protein [Brevundimonas sp.]